MRRKDQRKTSFALGILAFTYPLVAHALPGQPLNPGVTLKDVLGSWGEPEEKIERAVKREVVWKYKQGAYVVFKEGKLKASHVGDEEQARQNKKAAKMAVAVESKRKADAAVDSKDVLRDIVKEIPSGADVPYSEPLAPSNDPNVAGLIPNAIPNRSGPPGMAPVGVPALVDGEDG
jgi:hypothetical protein